MLAAKFAYISHYYDEFSLKQAHRHRGRAITRLGLNSASSVVAYLTSNRNRFKIPPDHITEKIQFGDGAGSELLPLLPAPLCWRQTWLTIGGVPEAYRDEIEFLMGLLKRNRLLASSDADIVQAGYERMQELKRNDDHQAIRALFGQARSCQPISGKRIDFGFHTGKSDKVFPGTPLTALVLHDPRGLSMLKVQQGRKGSKHYEGPGRDGQSGRGGGIWFDELVAKLVTETTKLNPYTTIRTSQRSVPLTPDAKMPYWPSFSSTATSSSR
ncbi:hypothetical protein BGW39_002886, partial [Mortierella sp. 14UC]